MAAAREDVRAVLAELRSDTAEARVAAARRVASLTDLNLVPLEAEHTAVAFHEAAAALAAGGACTSLAAMLQPSATHAEQQAACTALRCIFNVLVYLLHNDVAPRWARVKEEFIEPGAVCALLGKNPIPLNAAAQPRRSCTPAAARSASSTSSRLRRRRRRRATPSARCAWFLCVPWFVMQL